jgi:hypothetical protein
MASTNSFFQYLPTKPKPKRSDIAVKTNEFVKIMAKTQNSFIQSIAPVTQRKVRVSSTDGKATTRKVSHERDPDLELTKIDVDIYDIIYIDLQIKKKLCAKLRSVDDLRKELMNLLWIHNNSPDPVDKINAEVETTTLRRYIQDIESGFEYSLYILRTADMIEEYKTILSQTRTNSFVRIETTKQDEGKIYRKNQISVEYLRIAREYIDLENVHQKIHKSVCNACHGTEFSADNDDIAFLVCKCGNQIEVLDNTPSFKDAERVNMSSRYTYTCRGHFIEAMNRFEGKQNTEIDSTVIEILRKELALHSLSTDKVTKDHLYMFLAEKKLSDYYADINLIYFLITAKDPPDITNYRGELLDMLEQLEEAYREVKDSDRLNSLNVNWKLFKLLQLLEYPCRKDDFFCLKTPAKQGEHEEKWYDMIEYLKIKYPNAKTSKGKPRWRHIRTL